MDKGDMKKEIYRTFEVGKTYTKKAIKDILAGIYSNFGYNKIAKAVDIDSYFKTRRSRVKQQEAILILEKL